MKIRKLAQFICLVSASYIAPTLLSGGQFNQVMAAQEAGAKASVKVPAMRNRVYAQLARAQKLADEGDKIAGFEVLDEVKDRIDSLNSYEKAMLWNFYGFMYYGNDDVAMAIDSFENVVAQEAIPASLRLSTLYSLAQLAMQQQDYKKSLVFLNQWRELNGKALTSTQQVLFAQVYYQDKQYPQALSHIELAIDEVTAKGDIPKENWLILQRACFYELKQPEQVTKVMEALVRYYDKPAYWLQLGGMYAEIGQEDKQLAVMEAAWQAGYIEKSSDIISLAQLYLYHNVPFKAAILLEEAFEQGKVAPETKYLSMQAQAFIAAKEDDRAIPVLIAASKTSDNGEFDSQLAQSYLNTDKWQLAINSAETALKRGGVERMGNVYLVLGMAHFNLKNFEESLSAFEQALSFPKASKMASQWTKYVEREKTYQLQLAMTRK
ncbi:tetratricopeptide repeat protein [Thalassotalea sp. PLHSN55]|uniref:tetratricopeptide repeat protein n=1 Tax=Thalassotalea sp. PLHSN55 TaxID=3435888 RepID=UPI003F85F75E